jgi:hypothetical protein
MSFFRRDRASEASTLTMARDVVEIVAILAAGIWAFYVFVYENRIKPALQPPDVTITGSMDRVGRVHGLYAIRLTVEANNVGSTAVTFLAYSVTVIGTRVVLSKTPLYIMHTPYADAFQRHFRLVDSVVVYRNAFLTRDADPNTTTGFTLRPASSSKEDYVFYVPAGTYDRLNAVFVGRIERKGGPQMKTTMTIGPNGVPVIAGDTNPADDFDSYHTGVGTLSLP